jgi:capsular polysaccharide transport system permease protein
VHALIQGLRTQKRVLGALFMREIQLRWGRRNLGFAWVVAEPLVFAFPVLVMWTMIRHTGYSQNGLPFLAFIWSGYLPLLMFRHTTGHALNTIRQNGAVLYHRSISPLDLLICRTGLEIMGSFLAISSSFLVLYMLGYLSPPEDYPLFLMGLLYMAWWSVSVALIVGVLSERTELVQHIWIPASYMYMPLSGFIYLAQWLPPKVRDLALTVLPSLHAYEMIRGGLFGAQIQTYYDVRYVTFILAGMTLFALWQFRSVRQYLEFE